MAFARLTALLRRAAARNCDELRRAVGHVRNLVTDKECHIFFTAAGYETN